MPWPDLWASAPASSCCECWLLRTPSCPFLEKFTWDNNSFLALKVTPTHRALEGQICKQYKRPDPSLPQSQNEWWDLHYGPPHKVRQKPGSGQGHILAQLPLLPHPAALIPSADSVPSIDHFSKTSPDMVCLGNPSSVHRLLRPSGASHMGNHTLLGLVKTMTIF